VSSRAMGRRRLDRKGLSITVAGEDAFYSNVLKTYGL
jgi:hypothetical protein